MCTPPVAITCCYLIGLEIQITKNLSKNVALSSNGQIVIDNVGRLNNKALKLTFLQLQLMNYTIQNYIDRTLNPLAFHTFVVPFSKFSYF